MTTTHPTNHNPGRYSDSPSRLTVEEMIETATGILRDYGLNYASEHGQWLISTGVHPVLAKAIIDMAKINIIREREDLQ